MDKKIKILAVGDIHGDTGLVKKMAKKAKAENVDVVILTGDLTFAEVSTEGLIGPFVKEKKPVLVMHGNHESIATVDFLAELYPDTKNLHGYSFIKNNVGIFGCGGADFGTCFLDEKGFFYTLKKAHKGVENMKKKIMITHMHVAETMSEFSGFAGSSGIRKAVEKFQPDFLLHSHIHEAEGMQEKIGKTTVINVGRRGRIIEL
jgi:Icc-related predicted phosphoesterase